MQLTGLIGLLVIVVSIVSAAPSAFKRQSVCPLNTFSGLSVTASADPNGKTRWDLFTISIFQINSTGRFGLVQQEATQRKRSIHSRGREPAQLVYL
ncbi:hypothetical protein MIND_00317000 [Mycena indigotica]|uniref:Uncharacterized protein n=1 Tax=Mycena indigotica TaxID=2126181 RepID=A0A8H6T3Y3_9AGAR|nr:uncharacterized protein MIND_00317000 [Mycena indigotica]KAF7309462.1 hypothetical protein MIND_00317000 [Mycena indigotica]